jgi:LmbE family N-acetylglucosaminyl deacetylase
MPYNLFLLAHQDDEAVFFCEIENSVKSNIIPIIVYLTSGSRSGLPNQVRNLESTAVLASLKISAEQIYFLGSDGMVPDGRLIERCHSSFNSIVTLIESLGIPCGIYLMAWEGGHQDHDAAHLIGVKIAKKFNILNLTKQSPFYTGVGLPSILFRLFYPNVDNGNFSRIYIPWSERLKYIKLCLGYPSQWKTWVGILPFYIFHHLLGGGQILQNVSFERIKCRPHAGELLYERRGEYSWDIFSKKMRDID